MRKPAYMVSTVRVDDRIIIISEPTILSPFFNRVVLTILIMCA